MLKSSGGIKSVILVERFNTGGPNSTAVRMEYLFALQFWCCELYCGKPMRGETGSTIVNFCYLGVLWSLVGEGWWVGWDRKSHSRFYSWCYSRKWGIWCESRELRDSVSPRFPCVVPVVERFSSDLLPAIISYWPESHFEFCQTLTMELPYKNNQWP